MRACVLVCETKVEKSSKSDAYNNKKEEKKKKKKRRKSREQIITLETDVRGNMMAEARPDFIA